MSRILLVTSDDQWRGRLNDAFEGTLNGDLRSTGFERGLGGAAAEPVLRELALADADVMIVAPDVEENDALQLARSVDEHRPDVAVVLVAEPRTDLLERAVRSGVREVVAPGASLTEVHDALENVLESAARRRNVLRTEVMREVDKPRVITIVSPKGGAGKTAMSSNLAVGLAKRAANQVAIVDVDLQFGDVSHALRLSPERTLGDLARAGVAPDATMVKAFLTSHPAGLFALCAPESPAEADEVKPDMLGTTIDLLAEMFRFVVVDTAAGLDEATLVAMEHSTDIVVVCATDVASARGLRKEIDAFDVLGLTAQKRHFVLNRADARVGLTVKDIEQTVGLEVAVSIPSSRVVPTSMNEGAPVLELEPRSAVGRAMSDLVDRFAPPVFVPQPEPAGPRLFRRSKESR